MSWYYVNVTVHLFAALLWLGGMFFLAVVGAPVLRKVEDPLVRRELFRALGAQFRLVGWASIGVLLITGVLNLWLRGLLTWEVLGSGAFWGSRYGVALGWKLSAVTIMLGVQGVHDFVLGPASSTAAPGSPRALRLRRWAALSARVNAAVGIILVIAAVRLARGG
ncbi:MAG TPA: DUF4149 domain-containing protein [Longimicrobiales bacterium]|nr:DUF4149 domain-containing protein [Longimicrobiales bacterium]